MQRPEGGVVRGSVRGVGEAGEELLGVGVKEVAAIQLGREVRSSEDRVVAVVRDENGAVLSNAKSHSVGVPRWEPQGGVIVLAWTVHNERPHLCR